MERRKNKQKCRRRKKSLIQFFMLDFINNIQRRACVCVRDWELKAIYRFARKNFSFRLLSKHNWKTLLTCGAGKGFSLSTENFIFLVERQGDGRGKTKNKKKRKVFVSVLAVPWDIWSEVNLLLSNKIHQHFLVELQRKAKKREWSRKWPCFSHSPAGCFTHHITNKKWERSRPLPSS